MRRAQRARPVLVARGAVAPLQVVELVEQVAGVAHVAAHRLVGPPHRVGVDAQVQVHELHDVVDDVVRVLQRPQPLLGHARADHLVVVEAHAAVGERPGLRLADVVEQRGEAHDQLGPRVAHDRDRVREHVLVRVDRVLLEPHRG